MGIRDRLRARVKKLVGGAPPAGPSSPTAPSSPRAPTAPPPAPTPGTAAAPEPERRAPVARPSAPAAAPAPRVSPPAPPPAPDAAVAPAPPASAPPATAAPSPVAPSPVALAALLEDDHATSDAPVRNAHYAETFETTDAALRVRVYSEAEGLDLTFPCEPGEYVLDAAERAGHELPFSCRGGGCLVCAGRLDEGEVEMDEQYVLDEDHIAARFRLLCCTTVTTDAVFESHLEDAVD